MKPRVSTLLLPVTVLEAWLRGSERIPVEARQARGRLGPVPMAKEILKVWRQWRWPTWALSSIFFLFLLLLNYVPNVGGVLWLGLAPVISAAMLQLALKNPKVAGQTAGAWFRWAVRGVVLNYTVLAWFFFFLVCGAAVAVLFAGLLDWFLIRLPFKRAWSFSLLHLAWIFPLLFLLGVVGKAFRFYLGAYLALPLVTQRDGGVVRSIGASRTACRGRLGAVAGWMILGWVASFLPGLLYLGGTGILISSLVEKLPATFVSLWKIYTGSTLLFVGCLGLALLTWPFGFLVQAAAYRRVFSEAITPASPPAACPPEPSG